MPRLRPARVQGGGVSHDRSPRRGARSAGFRRATRDAVYGHIHPWDDAFVPPASEGWKVPVEWYKGFLAGLMFGELFFFGLIALKVIQ